MAPKQAPGGRPHSGEGSVTHRRQPLKSQKSQKLKRKTRHSWNLCNSMSPALASLTRLSSTRSRKIVLSVIFLRPRFRSAAAPWRSLGPTSPHFSPAYGRMRDRPQRTGSRAPPLFRYWAGLTSQRTGTAAPVTGQRRLVRISALVPRSHSRFKSRRRDRWISAPLNPNRSAKAQLFSETLILTWKILCYSSLQPEFPLAR